MSRALGAEGITPIAGFTIGHHHAFEPLRVDGENAEGLMASACYRAALSARPLVASERRATA